MRSATCMEKAIQFKSNQKAIQFKPHILEGAFSCCAKHISIFTMHWQRGGCERKMRVQQLTSHARLYALSPQLHRVRPCLSARTGLRLRRGVSGCFEFRVGGFGFGLRVWDRVSGLGFGIKNGLGSTIGLRFRVSSFGFREPLLTRGPRRLRTSSRPRGTSPAFRKVDVRLPGKGHSNPHGARPAHLIITMI